MSRLSFPLFHLELIISLLFTVDVESILLPSALQFHFIPLLRQIPLLCRQCTQPPQVIQFGLSAPVF